MSLTKSALRQRRATHVCICSIYKYRITFICRVYNSRMNSSPLLCFVHFIFVNVPSNTSSCPQVVYFSLVQFFCNNDIVLRNLQNIHPMKKKHCLVASDHTLTLAYFPYFKVHRRHIAKRLKLIFVGVVWSCLHVCSATFPFHRFPQCQY